MARKYFSVESILNSDPVTAVLPKGVLEDMLGQDAVMAYAGPDQHSEEEDYYVRKKSVMGFWEAVNDYLGRTAKLNIGYIKVVEAWRIFGRTAKRPFKAESESVKPYKKAIRPPLEQLDFFSYAIEVMEQRFRKEREQAAKRERDLLIQSDLGIELRELVTTLPSGKERPNTARILGEKMSEYIGGISPERVAEAAEILRRGTEFVRNRVNMYTRRYVVPRIRELEKALEQQSHTPSAAN